LPPGDIEISAVDVAALPGNAQGAEPMAVPDSMENAAGQMDSEATQNAMQQRQHSQTDVLAEEAQQKELATETRTRITPISRIKRLRSPLSKRNPIPSTPVQPTSKRHIEREEDEPSTSTPGRKKIKSSRASIVNVGLSPTHSVTSYMVGDDYDLGEDDDL
jgi:hypothetical protein